MKIIAEKKKFTDFYAFTKDIIKDSNNNKKQLFKYMLYCFVFIFISSLLTSFGGNFDIGALQSTAKNIESSTFNQNELTPLIINITNSFLSFFIFGITSISYLFFKNNPKSFKVNLLHFLNYKYYINFLFTIIFMFLFIIADVIIFTPAPLLNIEASQLSIIEVEKIILGFSNIDITLTAIGIFLFTFSIPFFLLGTIIGYMNVIESDTPILRTYFSTLFGIFRNFFFWFIPLTVYFLMIFNLYKSVLIPVNDFDIYSVTFNSALSAIFWGYGGYILFKLKSALYPSDSFNPTEDVRQRIIRENKQQ